MTVPDGLSYQRASARIGRIMAAIAVLGSARRRSRWRLEIGRRISGGSGDFGSEFLLDQRAWWTAWRAGAAAEPSYWRSVI